MKRVVAPVLGSALLGIEGVAIEVEVRISSQLPRVDIVGLPEAAVRESGARVRAAIAAVGLPFPDRRVTVNLAPAGMRKSGAGLDLPIALGILAAAGSLEPAAVSGLGLLGELALDGRLRPVRGALARVLALGEAGCRRVIVPELNGPEAALAPGLTIETAPDLARVLEALLTDRRLSPAVAAPAPASLRAAPDLADVRGQEGARRALLVAAAGGHGLLLRGPPGAGKTLLARVLPGLLPPLLPAEAVEVTRIHGAAGLLHANAPLVAERPFRAPHHSASRAGLLGGGNPPRPGEVSLAHRGVLFLDELPEFGRSALEALRQVLEEGRVHIARAGTRMTFPADFQLVAAANPCPCGFHRSELRDCRCDDAAVARYFGRISGPLLDRIDLHVQVPAVRWAELFGEAAGLSSREARASVAGAREIQRTRLAGSGHHSNAEIPFAGLALLTQPTPEAESLLARAVDRLGLSLRAAHRVLRVARTIADLAGEERVAPSALAEAIGYRSEESSASAPGVMNHSY